MITRFAIAVVAGALLTQAACGDVWEDLAGYEYGDEPNAGKAVETLLQETPVKEYGRLEKGLIRVVADADATQTGKAIACRMLQQVGTEACIPAVSKLLGHKILSHYACLVLERLKCEKADTAMREALEDAPDEVRIGLLGSLSERGDAETVPLAAKLARSEDPDLAEAAMRALGEIGGSRSAKALADLKPDDLLVPVHMRAMVACAESLQGEEAVDLCETVLAGPYSPARIAALRALAVAAPAKAAPRIADAVKGDDPKLAKGALGIVAATKGEPLTRAMLDLLGDLPPKRKAGLVLALGTRGDKTALGPLTTLIKSGQKGVRDAAVTAVSKVGDADSIPALLDVADTADLRARVAEAIARMTAEGIDEALAGALGKPGLRKAAIQASIARGATAAVPGLLKLARADEAATREEAWTGLASLATAEHMDGVMKVLLAARNEKERTWAEEAVKKIVPRAEDKAACFKAIARHYGRVPEATKGVLLDLGPVSGGASALGLERKALASGDEALYGRAVRALAAWPNASAAKDLLRLAKGADRKADRLVALRGYIRIAGLEGADLPDDRRTEMLKTAMDLAKRDQEKKQVVSSLQAAPTLESLNLLKQYMDDPALRAEAEMAAANLVWDLRTGHTEEVTAMAKQLLNSENKTVAKKASKTLADINKAHAFVRGWLISDVYAPRAKTGKALHEAVLPPEKGDKDVTWKRLTKGIGKDTIALRQAVGPKAPTSNCCVYVRTTLLAPSAQPVRLDLGSDDGIRVWLNGKLIHDHWVTRGVRPGEDKVKAKLDKGRNVLLMKITQGGGDWGFSCRLSQPDGKPIKGLQVKPE